MVDWVSGLGWLPVLVGINTEPACCFAGGSASTRTSEGTGAADAGTLEVSCVMVPPSGTGIWGVHSKQSCIYAWTVTSMKDNTFVHTSCGITITHIFQLMLSRNYNKIRCQIFKKTTTCNTDKSCRCMLQKMISCRLGHGCARSFG